MRRTKCKSRRRDEIALQGAMRGSRRWLVVRDARSEPVRWIGADPALVLIAKRFSPAPEVPARVRCSPGSRQAFVDLQGAFGHARPEAFSLL